MDGMHGKLPSAIADETLLNNRGLSKEDDNKEKGAEGESMYLNSASDAKVRERKKDVRPRTRRR